MEALTPSPVGASPPARSAPAQKPRPLPVITSAFTAGSARGLVDGLQRPAHQLVVEGIEPLRAVQREGGDALGHLVGDGHLSGPFCHQPGGEGGIDLGGARPLCQDGAAFRARPARRVRPPSR